MGLDFQTFAPGQRVILLDGAWGTELQKLGLQPGTLAELLNLERPEWPRSVARAYAEAGAEVILTNTFRANRLALAHHNLAGRSAEINEKGVRLSREGAQEAGARPAIIASMGPSGEVIMGDPDQAGKVYEAFKEQAIALERGGADGIVAETMMELEELLLALRAIRENTRLQAIASMTFDKGAARDRTAFGVTVEEMVKEATQAGAAVIGANCGNGLKNYIPIAARFRAASSLPVWIRANAGMPDAQDPRGGVQTPEEYAVMAKELVAAGATMIGGCCGTSPAFIRAMRSMISSRKLT